MGLKIVIEEEDGEDECITCPKCGEDCEADDKFCSECGAKLPTSPAVTASARMGAMQKAMAAESD